MARLPLDPRLARALLESKRFRAEGELLAIVAGLSVPDIRSAASGGPAAVKSAEDAGLRAAFEDNKSEFSSLVKVWRAYRKAREGPRRELRRWCKERGFSLLRLSEWDDVYAQVADRAAEIGIAAQRQAASYTGIHRSLLAGFCTMVGMRGEEGAYLGTRGVHFHIFPGSPLVRRRPRWVMAANIVETSRVFARRVAEIEPQWIEAAASHLLKREYLEPDWDEAREEVVARERLSFLGLILSANRVVNYGPIAPEESRRIFAREALVYGRLRRRPDWLLANDAAVREGERMEERLRTRGLLHGAETFVEFYDRALPRQVSSAATLEYFTRHLSAAERLALRLTPEHLFARQPEPEALAQFPEVASLGALSIPVEYRFAPGESRDGALLRIPLLALPGLTRAAVDAAVPGLALPRIEALLRSLPKDARRNLIPIGETAAQFLGRLACGRRGSIQPPDVAQGAARHPGGLAAIRFGRRAGALAAATGRDRRRQGHRLRRLLARIAPRRRRGRAHGTRAARPCRVWRGGRLAPGRTRRIARHRAAGARARLGAGVSVARARQRRARGAVRMVHRRGRPQLAAGRGASCAQHACRPGARSGQAHRRQRPIVARRKPVHGEPRAERDSAATGISPRLLRRRRGAAHAAGLRDRRRAGTLATASLLGGNHRPCALVVRRGARSTARTRCLAHRGGGRCRR